MSETVTRPYVAWQVFKGAVRIYSRWILGGVFFLFAAFIVRTWLPLALFVFALVLSYRQYRPPELPSTVTTSLDSHAAKVIESFGAGDGRRSDRPRPVIVDVSHPSVPSHYNYDESVS
jgi:hypothetical protein